MKKKIVCVEWADATSHVRIDRELIENTPIKYLIPKIKTYGIIIKEDEDGIVVVTENAGDLLDTTIIPKKWLIGIKKVK